MDRFGMDLGTTNSALCFYNDKIKAYEFLKIGNQTRDFFPTVIAYDKKNYEKRFVGEEAKEKQFGTKYDVYSLFKLSLGEGAHERNGREKTPYEVTRDFLKAVIDQFHDYIGCKDLNNLVLTVPDVWKNEDKNRVAADNLMRIFEELGLEAEEQAVLESEPVSAVAYYCRQICEKPYNGYVIVIDYGGGTLDLTLCKVEDGENITVLRRCGDGGTNAMGCAGVAFDTALTRRLIENNKESLDCKEGTNRFFRLRNAVENAKIAAAAETRDVLIQYYSNYGCVDGTAFDVIFEDKDGECREYSVMASDIDMIFEQVNAAALKQALKTVKTYCSELDINLHDQNQMRILMVGGFSNLYCVEAACREAFSTDVNVGSDKRFDEKMRRAGRPSTAIAHGAGIIAAGAAKIDYYCQSDVGFFYYDIFEEKELPMAVICRDTPVKEYKEPKFAQGLYTFRDYNQNLQVRLFFDDGMGIVPVTMDESFRDLFGEAYEEDGVYQIGFSMGKHRIPMIHVRDQKGRENCISLSKVLSRIALRNVDAFKTQEEKA